MRPGIVIALLISAFIVVVTVRADANMSIRSSLLQSSPPKKCQHMYRWSWQWGKCVRSAIYRAP